MGLFGKSRAHKEPHCERVLSPARKSTGTIPLSKTKISNLFADDPEDDCDNHRSISSTAPTVHMDDMEDRSISMVELSTSIRDLFHNSDEEPDRVSRMNARIVDDDEDNEEEERPDSPSRQDAIAVTAHRDSIKRSISRKFKRSESRRQQLNAKSMLRASPQKDRKPVWNQENRNGQTTLSPISTAVSGKENFNPTDLLDDPDSPSKLQVDPDIAAEGDVKSISAQPDSLMVISRDPVGLGMPGQAPESKKTGRSRRRPPPLLAKSGGAPDSALDWPSAGLFGSDGGFMTGGFKITQDGMVGKPDFATRCDSHVHGDPEVSVSINHFILCQSLKEFRPGPTIGSGAAGRVYIAEHMPSKVTMAMKVVNVYNKEKRNQLLKELETLSIHNSRYLVRFFGAFYDGSGAVHIALEYMDHGCLSSFVQRVGAIPEPIVQMIAVDCIRGLRFLHRHHVLHRDFKTANILLSRKQCCAKLSDFGLARDLNPGVSKVDTFVGTVAYMSPERLHGTAYTYASDIWALGVSVVECLIGRHPFNRPQNYFDYIEATANSATLSGFDSAEQKFTAEARNFVTMCTYTDPKERPTAFQLLQHPWVKGIKRDLDLFGSWLDESRTKSLHVKPSS